ncbi:unnamed protein product, partial [Polarella glacialis]
MGQKNAAPKRITTEDRGLQAVRSRTQERMGNVSVSGRYHRLPKRMEDDYVILKSVLGTGYNGEVLMAECKHTKGKFAVKGFKLHGVSKDKMQDLETEAEIFLSMDHPHVARLVDVYESDSQLQLVMECMTGGELFERVSEKKRFNEKDAAEAAYQMLLAVNYLHSHNIVHRDIKLENFLYEAKESDQLKMIDFGFSKVWAPNTTMANSCGTLAYVAPEVLDGSYTSQCDIWSLGVVVFILLFGYMPFGGSEAKQIHDIHNGKYGYKKVYWDRVSAVAQDFVRKMLVVDQSKRLTAAQALEHEWLMTREHHSTAVDQAVVDALCNFGKASTFRRACLGVMAWSLSSEERQAVREAFLELDSNHTGAITLQEFKQALEDTFHINCTEVEKAFQALDVSHHDEIHYTEFLAAMVSSRIALHDDLLKDTFRRFDVDNSGFITPDNLREVLGETMEGCAVEQLMEEADFKHDGRISYEEWIVYLRGSSADQTHTDAANLVIDKHVETEDRKRGKGKKLTLRAGPGIQGGMHSSPALIVFSDRKVEEILLEGVLVEQEEIAIDSQLKTPQK